jgi:hypothetical protein
MSIIESVRQILPDFPSDRRTIAAVITLLAVCSSGVWLAAKSVYEGEIRALKEQVNLVRERAAWAQTRAEEVSKQCAQTTPAVTPSPASSQPSPSTPPPKQGVSAPPSGPALTTQPYPRIADSSHLTKPEVRAMAEYYGLFRNWSVNPHLKLKTGDISYWYEQQLSERALQLEFDSRRIVLERAERSGQRIPTQGDLSALAQEIQATIAK